MSYKSAWIIFCQLVTFTLGLLFIFSTLKPSWFESVVDNLGIGNSEKVHLEFCDRSINQENGKEDNPDYKFGFTEAAITAMPSVVHILSKQNNILSRHPFFADPLFEKFLFESENFLKGDKKPTYQSLGSGVIVADGGFVITNYHVIREATELEVTLAGGEKNQQRL